VLDWAEAGKDPHAGLLEWHKALIALRRRFPSLSDGNFDEVRPTWDEDAGWFCLTRGEITVAANLADRSQPVPIPDGPMTVLLASDPAATSSAGGQVTLPPDSVAVLGPED
jgi:maltooligosyltrehalose trehalohydrolase